MSLDVVRPSILMLLIFSCTHNSTPPPSQSMPKEVVEKIEVAQPPNDCISFSGGEIQFPFFVGSDLIVATRLVKGCTTNEGSLGYNDKTSWMAMGFPCTGGGGVVKHTGLAANPKMVAFGVTNSCPMNPKSLSAVKNVGRRELGFPNTLSLVAYYPFDLLFWEFLDFEDADTGHVIEIRSRAGLDSAWKQFLNFEPLRLKMYGRENAWVPDNKFFSVEGTLYREQVEDELKFGLTILHAKALTSQEIAEIKLRCESLVPRRNCKRVFN